MAKMAPSKKSNPNSFYFRRKNEKIENKNKAENYFYGKPQLERLPLWIGMRMIERMDSGQAGQALLTGV